MVAPLVAALLGLSGGLTASKLFSSPEQAPVQPGLVPFDNGQGDGGVVGNISPNLNVPTAPASVNPTAQDVNALGPLNLATNPGYAGIEGDLLNEIAPFNAARDAERTIAPKATTQTATQEILNAPSIDPPVTPLGTDQQRNFANVKQFPKGATDAILGKGKLLKAQSVKEGTAAFDAANQGDGIIETTKNAAMAPGGAGDLVLQLANALGINGDSIETARQAGGTVLKEASAPSQPPHILGYPIDMPTPSPSPPLVKALTGGGTNQTENIVPSDHFSYPDQNAEITLPTPSLADAIKSATPDTGEETARPRVPYPLQSSQPPEPDPGPAPAPPPASSTFDTGQTGDQAQTQGIDQQMLTLVQRSLVGDTDAVEDIRRFREAATQPGASPTLLQIVASIDKALSEYR